MGLGTGFMFLAIASGKMQNKEGLKFRLNSMAMSCIGHIGLVLLIISGVALMTPYWSLVAPSPLRIAFFAKHCKG
jgi:hypothetical protein